MIINNFPKMSGIYVIINIKNNKKYVGQSENIHRRINHHLNNLRQNKHYNIHLQNSWNKYGEDNFDIKVIELCDIDDLDKKEIEWIAKLDTYNNGYNLNLGGDSNRGYKFTEEVKQKMREHHADFSGNKNPMYGKSLYDILNDDEIIQWKKKISIANSEENNYFYGKHHTGETRQKISESMKEYYKYNNSPFKGKKHSEESILKMSKAHKNQNCGTDNSNSIKIICLNTLEVFDCINQASKKYDICSSSISNCCSHKSNSAGKDKNKIPYVWMYYEEYLKNKNIINIDKIIQSAIDVKKGKNNHNAKKVKCITTNEVFNCIMDASKKYNIDNSSIVKCCKNKISYVGIHPVTKEKMVWEYYND